MDHTKMTITDYMNFLKNDVPYTVFSSVDENGKTDSRIISVMLVQEDKLYFLTSTSKPFYEQLAKNPSISITGMKGDQTMGSMAVTVNGDVKEIGTKYLDVILEQNPYLHGIYPTQEKLDLLRVFEVGSGSVKVYDLGEKPPYQKTLKF